VTHDRILGHLAQRFAVSEENLATESLTWLLRRSAAARAAVTGLGRGIGLDLSDDLTFVGQVGSAETGQPDVVGTDSQNRERLLIEAKFAAGLTDQQPNGYLKRLPADVDGLLLFVAPDVRRATLWVELLRAIPQLADPVPAPSAVADTGTLYVKISERTTLALVGWRSLVTRVLDAVRAADESVLAQDGEQLLALTEAMDNAAFVPLRPGDLDLRTARQIAQLEGVIDDAYEHIIAASSVAERYSTKSSHGRIFYGWWVSSRKTKKRIWYGFLPRAWGRYGISPLWAQVRVGPSWSRQRLLQALSGLHEDEQPGLFDDGESFLIPLAIPDFGGQQEVVDNLRHQVHDIVVRLDAVVAPGEPPMPDEPSVDEQEDLPI